MHCAEDVLFGRLAHRILLVIGQYDHILPRVAEILVQVGAHVLDIVDTTSQLPALVKVVDSNQKRFPPSRTITILEVIALRCTIAKRLCCLWGRWRGTVVALHVCIRVDSW